MKLPWRIDDARLRLRIPAALLPDNQTQFIGLGLDDTLANRPIAEAKILQIRGDMLDGYFDPTLDKYRKFPDPSSDRSA